MVEDVLTDEDLTALMEAREHDGSPAELARDVYGMPYWLIGDTGWNSLIRAAFHAPAAAVVRRTSPPAPVVGREGERSQAEVPQLRGLPVSTRTDGASPPS